MVFARSKRFGLVAVATLVAACSSGKGPRVPETGGPELGATHVPWKSKTHEEREAYMAAHVEPVMAKLFRKHDQKEYADFGCATCHGKDMDAVDFAMPHSLPPLDAKDPVADAMNTDEDTAKFMVDEVLPTFSKLLAGRTHEDKPVTCFTCHPSG